MIVLDTNNLEIKGLTTGVGHEEELIMEGNLYYKNKKVGRVWQDSWSGTTEHSFDSVGKDKLNEVKTAIQTTAQQLVEDKYINDEYMYTMLVLDFLLNLKLTEKDLKNLKRSTHIEPMIIDIEMKSYINEHNIEIKRRDYKYSIDLGNKELNADKLKRTLISNTENLKEEDIEAIMITKLDEKDKVYYFQLEE